ncbi:hypothetical protein B0H11DRAFT_2226516 [Mycena galericulata]|nr:hypothetical protein B0H11DRAFT_2226516 [Mycena galericulata]
MAPRAGCVDCGLIFKNLSSDRANYLKCEKLEGCAGDQQAIDLVEKMKQCVDCSIVYRYFPVGRTMCGPCENKAAAPKKAPQPDKPGKKENEKEEVISVEDSDSDVHIDSDSDVAVAAKVPMAALNTNILKQKAKASSFRLTPKGVDSEIPGRTRVFLDKREANRGTKRAGDPSKAAQILFKTAIYLQKERGQKQGTRVPPQSRGFSMEDRMEHVFQKLVDMVNEPDSPWLQQFPGKTFSRDIVQFTFKDGTGIPLEYTTGSTTVASFWTVHTRLNEQYFKKSSITASTAEISMLIPLEATLDEEIVVEGDLYDDILSNGKRHRNSKGSKHLPKRSKRVKLEAKDYTVKDEPTEITLASSSATSRRSSTVHPPVSLRLKTLTYPIVFTKSDGSTPPKVSEEMKGTRDAGTVTNPEMGTHFQLTHDGKHYLARRLEDAGFRFSTELELVAANAEMIRGNKLRELLQDVSQKYIADVPELQGFSTPELFIATVKERTAILGHFICQPKPVIPFGDIRELTSELLDAISHYSYVDAGEEWILLNFKYAKEADGSISLFAPVSHSIKADSGLFDGGPEGIASFKADHVCTQICLNFGLTPF